MKTSSDTLKHWLFKYNCNRMMVIKVKVKASLLMNGVLQGFIYPVRVVFVVAVSGPHLGVNGARTCKHSPPTNQ